mgnify:CR=1 FL=1
MGQNERNAKSGTSVESCSLLLLTSLHFTTDIFSAKSRVCICKHFVNKLPSPAVRRCNSFCFYGIAAAIGLRHTNGNIGVTIATFNQSVFLSPYPYYNFKSAFWPVFRKLFCRTKKERSALQTVHKTHRFLIPNDTYERVQTVPHLWRCKKQSAGAVNEQMPREIALTRHLQHFAYKAVRDA